MTFIKGCTAILFYLLISQYSELWYGCSPVYGLTQPLEELPSVVLAMVAEELKMNSDIRWSEKASK